MGTKTRPGQQGGAARKSRKVQAERSAAKRRSEGEARLGLARKNDQASTKVRLGRHGKSRQDAALPSVRLGQRLHEGRGLEGAARKALSWRSSTKMLDAALPSVQLGQRLHEGAARKLRKVHASQGRREAWTLCKKTENQRDAY